MTGFSGFSTYPSLGMTGQRLLLAGAKSALVEIWDFVFQSIKKILFVPPSLLECHDIFLKVDQYDPKRPRLIKLIEHTRTCQALLKMTFNIKRNGEEMDENDIHWIQHDPYHIKYLKLLYFV
jgi:hypothetical protein